MDRRFKLRVIAGFALVLCLGPLQRAEASTDIVVNGNFDLDSPPTFGTAPLGWTLAGAATGSMFYVTSGGTYGAYSPPNSANFGATGAFDDVLSQTLATTPGMIYTFDFFLAHNGTDAANDFHVLWNGVSVFDLVNAASFDYTEHTFSETATGETTTIEFDGRENPAWYELDNVSVTDTGVLATDTDVTAPEPGTLFLLGAGLIGVGILRRKKQQHSRL